MQTVVNVVHLLMLLLYHGTAMVFNIYCMQDMQQNKPKWVTKSAQIHNQLLEKLGQLSQKKKKRGEE